MRLDEKRIPKELDRRRKLTNGDKKRIRELYKDGLHSQRQLAGMFGCSRRLIVFVLYPEREKIQKDRVKKEKRWLKYYNKDKTREYMRSHRAYKRTIKDDLL